MNEEDGYLDTHDLYFSSPALPSPIDRILGYSAYAGRAFFGSTKLPDAIFSSEDGSAFDLSTALPSAPAVLIPPVSVPGVPESVLAPVSWTGERAEYRGEK